MKAKSATIINKLGMHARAAARFVKLASSFECDVHVIRNGKRVNGKSIMGIMMLAAAKDAVIEIVTSGSDEVAAMAEIEKLILDRFGEDE